MTSQALARVYGYGYESSTADGRIPYSYNYNLDYDYPLPNWSDPRWAPSPDSPDKTVYAKQIRTIGAYGQAVQLAEPVPLERSRLPRQSATPPILQKGRLPLLGLLGVLVVFVALVTL